MFIHSDKVPQIYKKAAKCLQNIIENGASAREIIYNQRKHINTKALYALVTKTLQHYSQINSLLDKSKLLINESRFNPWLARILVTQLFWSENGLKGDCKPIAIILSYQSELEKHHVETEKEQSGVSKPRYARVNTFALTIDEAIDGFIGEGWELVEHRKDDYDAFIKQVKTLEIGQFMLDLHIKELLIFSCKTELYNHPTYHCKSIYLQDKASCIPVHVLNPLPGSVVLDMCAAPGLKTLCLAERLQNQGTIYAIEKDVNRYNTLTSMIEETGATCIKTINKDALEVSSEECPNVEYILVDPTCSGSGIVNRVDIDEVKVVDEARIEKLAKFQILLLKHALTKFRNAKRVVYSTCSIHSKENDYVVSEILKKKLNYKLVSAHNLLTHRFSHAFQDDADQNLINIRNKCIYTIPERDLTNGFFVALFQRDTIISNETEKKIKDSNENSLTKRELGDSEQISNIKNKETHDHQHNQDSIEATTKTHKKKKRIAEESVTNNVKKEIYPCTEQSNAEISHKKRKTKHVYEDTSELIEKEMKKLKADMRLKDESIDEGLATKKKKKKKHRDNLSEEEEGDLNASSHELIKKKKKKKKNDCVAEEVDQSTPFDGEKLPINQDLSIPEKKSKKHKKRTKED